MVLLAGAFFGISRTSGAGWATVLVTGILGTCVAGFILPAIVLGRAGLSVSTPREGTVGTLLPIEVDGRTGVIADIAELGSGPFQSGKGTINVTPSRRGVFDQCKVELRTSAPLGLVVWKRSQRVTLDRSIEIGPKVIASTAPPPTARQSTGDEDVRGVRAYTPGDAMRAVHWPATARTAELTVRQYDAPSQPELVIAVDLTGDRGAAEARASRAAGLALDALDVGSVVLLATSEPNGPVTAQVASRSEINRRLARAIAGPLQIAPDCKVIEP